MPTIWKRPRWVVPRGSTTSTPQTRSDDELLVAVAGGDNQALASLYDHVAGLVCANVWRALRDPTRTDTVLEETFVEVWRQAGRFDPARTPAVIWILDLAHQLAAEHNRYDDSRAPAEQTTNDVVHLQEVE